MNFRAYSGWFVTAALLISMFVVGSAAGPTTPAQINGGVYNSVPPNLFNQQTGVFQLDPRGQLKTSSGGYEFLTSTMPPIQNASYAAANCMGGFQAVSVARMNGGAGILNRLIIASKGGGTTALTIYTFAQNPLSSTCIDRGTFTLNAADISKQICAPFVVTPAASAGTTVTEAENTSMQCHFITSGDDTNIYVAIVSGGTWTPASATDIIFNVEGIQD